MRQYKTRPLPFKILPLFSSVKVGFSLSSNLEDLHKVESFSAVPFPVGWGQGGRGTTATTRLVHFTQLQIDCPRTHMPSIYRTLFSKMNSLSSFLQSTKIVEIFVKLLTIHISSLMNHSLPRLNKCMSLQSVAQYSRLHSKDTHLFYMHSQQRRGTQVIKKYLSVVFQRELFKMYLINILITGLQLNFVVSFQLEKH